MNEKETGGPAFPCDLTMYDQEVIDAFQGATLRDYFAAKAMQWFLSGAGPLDGSWHIDAEAAYAVSDAMLEARK